MKHLAAILFFSVMAAVVFGIVGQATRREQIRYGWQTALKFALFALILGWLMYFIPL